MTRFRAVVVALLLATSAFIAHSGSVQAMDQVSAQTLPNAPARLTQTNLSAAAPSTMSLTTIVVGQSTAYLAGSVAEPDGNQVPFDVAGTLGRNFVPGSVVGDLTDRLGNFDVLYFATDSNPAQDSLIARPSTATAASEMVAIYLVRRGLTFSTVWPAGITQRNSSSTAVVQASGSLAIDASPNEVLFGHRYAGARLDYNTGETRMLKQWAQPRKVHEASTIWLPQNDNLENVGNNLSGSWWFENVGVYEANVDSAVTFSYNLQLEEYPSPSEPYGNPQHDVLYFYTDVTTYS